MHRRDTLVKAYKTRRQMERGINRLARRGYRVKTQSGDFSRNPFMFRWRRHKTIVVFERAV